MLADRLFQIEDERTLQFIAPLSEHASRRRNMTLLYPAIGTPKSTILSGEEASAIQRLKNLNLTSIHDTTQCS